MASSRGSQTPKARRSPIPLSDIKKNNQKTKGNQSIIFRKDTFKKDKGGQYINNTTRPNMISWSPYNPSYQTGQENAIKKNFPGYFSIKVENIEKLPLRFFIGHHNNNTTFVRQPDNDQF